MLHVALEEKSLHAMKPRYIASIVEGDEPNRRDFLWRLITACLEVKAYDHANAQMCLFSIQMWITFQGSRENFRD